MTTQRVAARLAHRSALRALNRWREYAGERAELRAKAQAVVKHMLLRRLYAGLWWVWFCKAAALVLRWLWQL